MAWYSVIWCGSVSYDVVWYLLLYDVVWFGMMYSYVLPNDEAWYDWVHLTSVSWESVATLSAYCVEFLH